MVIRFSCKICNKAIANNHHAVQCDKYHTWAHLKCNKINLQYCITDELFKTNQGSKTKFTVLAKNHALPS